MHILYLVQLFSPSVGGGEALFYYFAREMLERGHQVSIICYKRKSSFDLYDLIRKGIKIYSIKPEIEDVHAPVLTYMQHIKYIMNAVGKGHEVINKNNVDIIHANTYTPIIPAVILGRVFKIPVVATIHHITLGCWKYWASQEGVPAGSSFIGPFYEKLVLKMPVQMAHVVSESTKKDLIKINAKVRINVLYNGIDIQEYNGLTSEEHYQKYLLFIGRLVSTKNLNTVILALKHVIIDFPDVKLVVVGRGPMRNNWEQLSVENGLNSNISFAGHISETEKFNLLRNCTALVLPSILEGFGRVIIEAFAMSKPVLASKIRSLSEVIDDGKDGFLIPPYDIKSWANAIKDVFRNFEKGKAMGISGRKKAEDKFNLKVLSDGIEKLYNDVISDSPFLSSQNCSRSSNSKTL